jgi:DNA-binding IclR family transcriptional regulator
MSEFYSVCRDPEIEQRAIDIINNEKIMPRELAARLSISRSSCRVLTSRMIREGTIGQAWYRKEYYLAKG